MTHTRPQEDDLSALLELQAIDSAVAGINVFEGLSPHTEWGRIFGGQLLAQSLVAAQNTVASLAARPVHSFSHHFLRPGNPDLPIHYQVETIRDGRSFSTRHVRASQEGKGIGMMTVSFQDLEDGFEHQQPMPEVPSPESLALTPQQMRQRVQHLPADIQQQMLKAWPIEMRFITERNMYDPQPGEPNVDLWFRVADFVDIADNSAAQAAILSYASDLSFMDTALVPHGSSLMDPAVHGVSLDHSLWFHNSFDIKQWLLFIRESTWAHHGRAYVRGMIYNRQGVLVASVVQECLIRKVA